MVEKEEIIEGEGMKRRLIAQTIVFSLPAWLRDRGCGQTVPAFCKVSARGFWGFNQIPL
ncbi:MAG: hypothetical protein IKJ45_18345 [Kiritimatiellae bacterium]|nr:hypothetical protein [Kiritimatiellia bacterium]